MTLETHLGLVAIPKTFSFFHNIDIVTTLIQKSIDSQVIQVQASSSKTYLNACCQVLSNS
jgi:hypothetical protein